MKTTYHVEATGQNINIVGQNNVVSATVIGNNPTPLSVTESLRTPSLFPGVDGAQGRVAAINWMNGQGHLDSDHITPFTGKIFRCAAISIAQQTNATPTGTVEAALDSVLDGVTEFVEIGKLIPYVGTAPSGHERTAFRFYWKPTKREIANGMNSGNQNGVPLWLVLVAFFAKPGLGVGKSYALNCDITCSYHVNSSGRLLGR